MTMTRSTIRPFDHLMAEAWPYRFQVTLAMDTIAGGVPSDPKVAEGWLRTKLQDPDDVIREAVAATMAERGVSAAEATEIVDRQKHLNGFKRTPEGLLYIEGRQVKAAIKEAVNVAVAAGKIEGKGWGKTRKGSSGFVAEHIVVSDDVITLTREDGSPVTGPDEVIQRFVHTFRGNGIQYEEVCRRVFLSFTLRTDWAFEEKFWGLMWLTGGFQGLGSSRSQGMGRYEVVGWDPIGVIS